MWKSTGSPSCSALLNISTPPHIHVFKTTLAPKSKQRGCWNECRYCIKQGWHFYDSVARIGTTRVVPVRKLVVNWREVYVNPSWLRAMSGQEFWNVQNFGHDKISRPGRELCANCSWTRRDDAGGCVPVRAMPRLSRTATDSSRTAHVEFTCSSRHVNEQFTNSSRAVHDYCAIVALASMRGYIHGFLDTARHSRDRQRGDMPLQQSRQNGTICHDKTVAKSRASVSLA